jgi:L-amino acid N-acyltransferase YncA
VRPVAVRPARPEDFATVAAVIDQWWGRPMHGVLSRLFFDHFHATSSVAEDDRLAGFLVGFHSPSLPGASYVHVIGVRPDQRREGLARLLYDRFAGQARAAGSHELRAITSPANLDSVRFHERLGFTVTGPVADYNGPGRPMFTFARRLG